MSFICCIIAGMKEEKTKVIWYKHDYEKNTLVECDESEGVIWAVVDEYNRKAMKNIELEAFKQVLEKPNSSKDDGFSHIRIV